MMGLSPWSPGKGPKKFEKFILKILKKKECFGNTYVVRGAAVYFGIFCCAMLVRSSSSSMLLAIHHYEE